MFDHRSSKVIQLGEAVELKPDATYSFKDLTTGLKLVAKIISDYQDDSDLILIAEFKKMALLSAEPQIATVYFLAKCQRGSELKSCYVLEFIDGRSLGCILSDDVAITHQVAESYIIDISRGLERAHAAGIFHNDLHEENIFIDRFDNVKIIDFLWHSFRDDRDVQQSRDLAAFKRMVEKIYAKCDDSSKLRLDLCLSLILGSKNFHGLPKKIELILDVTEEFSFLGKISRDLLATFFQVVPANYKLKTVYRFDPQPVPESVLIEVPEECPPKPQLQPFVVSRGGELARPPKIDVRLLKIDSAVRRRFESACYELSKLGLIDVRTNVAGSDANRFWPPYMFTCGFSFSPKFLRWKASIESSGITLPCSEESLMDVIFSESTAISDL